MSKKFLIKEKLYNLLIENLDQDIILTLNEKKISYRDLNLNILRCITYIKKNFKKKNIIYIGSNTKNFFVFFLACLFSNYKIFPIDPKTKKSNIINLKKKFKFDYIVKDFDLKKLKKKNWER